MKTLLIFAALVAIFGFSWAQNKPEFILNTTRCRNSPFISAKYCDSFNNPFYCMGECSVSYVEIIYYCYGQVVDHDSCTNRLAAPYSPETVICPSSTDDIWKYCYRYYMKSLCEDECARRLQK